MTNKARHQILTISPKQHEHTHADLSLPYHTTFELADCTNTRERAQINGMAFPNLGRDKELHILNIAEVDEVCIIPFSSFSSFLPSFLP